MPHTFSLIEIILTTIESRKSEPQVKHARYAFSINTNIITNTGGHINNTADK